ncbi:hypothetical protein HYPSUDRAFT_32830 [Hypholoma sublateritium FD-334 SS-4]|uniref:Uncharacterized protein n=1 Tax=Hypholoma sublateritium (strain FD-334 SS-4) TaxID=945553 RepID=A0A0D2QCN1_HYPSF|nr:hypothetical protein HYPSUDRAFT_32830 [Hypholoma sublateritium FD-334 SS-4]
MASSVDSQVPQQHDSAEIVSLPTMPGSHANQRWPKVTWTSMPFLSTLRLPVRLHPSSDRSEMIVVLHQVRQLQASSRPYQRVKAVASARTISDGNANVCEIALGQRADAQLFTRRAVDFPVGTGKKIRCFLDRLHLEWISRTGRSIRDSRFARRATSRVSRMRKLIPGKTRTCSI